MWKESHHEESFTEVILCMCVVQLFSISVLLSAADHTLPSLCTSEELYCYNLLILPPCRSNCGFDVRVEVGLDIAWEQR